MREPFRLDHGIVPAVSSCLYYIIEIAGNESELRFGVSVKFSSVIHLTVDNYYLRGFGFISISV